MPSNAGRASDTTDSCLIGILSFPNRLATNGILSGRDVEEEGASLLAELHRLAEDENVCLSRARMQEPKPIAPR